MKGRVGDRPVHGPLEADLKVEANFENPFEPEQVNVTAVFTSPSGQVIGTPHSTTKTSTGHWPAMMKGSALSATLTGRSDSLQPRSVNTFYASLEDEGRVVTSDTAAFSVSPSESRGFVRTSAEDHRYFQFDDCSSFFFIGLKFLERF